MFLCAILVVNAQSSQFHAGLSFPTGDFGDDDPKSEKGGAASMGFNIGYKYYSPLPNPYLSLVFGIDIFYNDLTGDEKDRWEKNYKDYDISFSKYINAPISGGLNFTYPATEKIGVYGEFALKLNTSWLTPLTIEHNSSGAEVKQKYDPAFKICYGLEGGILINKRYTIGLQYNQFGTYKYKYKQTVEYNGNKDSEKDKTGKRPISNVTLAFGIKF